MSGARETPLSVFVAIFLLSFAALLFQFVQTRLFSTMLDYHLTFLVVSGALLGVAGAGAALHATSRAEAQTKAMTFFINRRQSFLGCSREEYCPTLPPALGRCSAGR